MSAGQSFTTQCKVHKDNGSLYRIHTHIFMLIHTPALALTTRQNLMQVWVFVNKKGFTLVTLTSDFITVVHFVTQLSWAIWLHRCLLRVLGSLCSLARSWPLADFSDYRNVMGVQAAGWMNCLCVGVFVFVCVCVCVGGMLHGRNAFNF